MLNKLLPDQVAKFWDIIKYGIEQSLPPIVTNHPDKMNRILASCLMGQAEVWASYIRNNGNVKFNGIVITRLLVDDVSMTNNLLIYCIYGYESIDSQTWLQGLKALADYAKAKKCSQVVAYSYFPQIASLAKRLGGEVEYFITFDINKIIQNLGEL